MANRILELYGYNATDRSNVARSARKSEYCPFLNRKCTKTLNDGITSGVCTLETTRGESVICCPNRLYAQDYRILKDVAEESFGKDIPLQAPHSTDKLSGSRIVVFGHDWGKELRLPSRGKGGAYSVDWVLAHVSESGDLKSFVAVEVQSIDTTGNYRAERDALLRNVEFRDRTTAGFNWENVNKRILPQIIYKGHVLRQETLCKKGLFFVCPSPVYNKIIERLGGDLTPYPIQPGSLTMLWYDLDSEQEVGEIRKIGKAGTFTTTIDQVAHAFTSPKNLPPAGVYENAIRAGLAR